MLWLFTLSMIVLLPACFERSCGRYQELRDGACFCVEGRSFDANLQCVPVDASVSRDGASEAAVPAGDDGSSCDAMTGLGCACSSDADCAGFAADYCVLPDPNDPAARRACLFQGCEQPGKACPQGLRCCAFSFAPEGSICLPESSACPFG